MLKVVLGALKNFSPAEEAKLRAALKLLETTMNSPEFKARVLEFKYLGKFQFAQNEGLTNAQVYDKLMAGAEQLSPSIDSEMDLSLELYTPPWWKRLRNNVVGYTNPGTAVIFMNRSFFSRFELWEIAANIAHEWTHKLGFDHDFNATARRPYSVPYAVGSIVNAIAAFYATEQKVE